MEAEKTQRELAKEWLGFVLQGWGKQLKKLKIHSSGELERSFEGAVIAAANGDLLKVKIAYAWYGAMVDMGVGRGTKLGEQKSNATSRRLIGRVLGNQRKPKRWYSEGRDSIGHQVNQLSYLIGVNASLQAAERLVPGSKNEQIVINL
ncbi:hypothetical protein [Rufibacter hautae]|uniref:Uncharacterized protein n=1 Tax=Rufibacter hautae TaxID=2595005 RepID=A0A5B6THU4_9BACT|nr:hypothetical protein [Rufibacter hautae]KAA3439566.1 hypothetical protein FOA19_02455 [Rufibacter hautae]